jgi:hypothetical protein
LPSHWKAPRTYEFFVDFGAKLERILKRRRAALELLLLSLKIGLLITAYGQIAVNAR